MSKGLLVSTPYLGTWTVRLMNGLCVFALHLPVADSCMGGHVYCLKIHGASKLFLAGPTGGPHSPSDIKGNLHKASSSRSKVASPGTGI